MIKINIAGKWLFNTSCPMAHRISVTNTCVTNNQLRAVRWMIIGFAKCKKHPFLNGTLVWKTLWFDVLCGKIGNKSEAKQWQNCNANPLSMRLEYGICKPPWFRIVPFSIRSMCVCAGRYKHGNQYAFFILERCSDPSFKLFNTSGGHRYCSRCPHSPSLCVEREAGDNASSVGLSGAACEGAGRSGCKAGSDV